MVDEVTYDGQVALKGLPQPPEFSELTPFVPDHVADLEVVAYRERGASAHVKSEPHVFRRGLDLYSACSRLHLERGKVGDGIGLVFRHEVALAIGLVDLEPELGLISNQVF